MSPTSPLTLSDNPRRLGARVGGKNGFYDLASVFYKLRTMLERDGHFLGCARNQ